MSWAEGMARVLGEEREVESVGSLEGQLVSMVWGADEFGGSTCETCLATEHTSG